MIYINKIDHITTKRNNMKLVVMFQLGNDIFCRQII